MSVTPSTLEFVIDQISGAGHITWKRMFGEVGIYCDGKFAALICDDQFFIKPTDAGNSFAPGLPTGSPYPGAKPHLLIDGDRLEDADWVSELLRVTTAELPLPKPKKKVTKKT